MYDTYTGLKESLEFLSEKRVFELDMPFRGDIQEDFPDIAYATGLGFVNGIITAATTPKHRTNRAVHIMPPVQESLAEVVKLIKSERPIQQRPKISLSNENWVYCAGIVGKLAPYICDTAHFIFDTAQIGDSLLDAYFENETQYKVPQKNTPLGQMEADLAILDRTFRDMPIYKLRMR